MCMRVCVWIVCSVFVWVVWCVVQKHGGHDPDSDQITVKLCTCMSQKSTVTVLLSWIGLATMLVLVSTSFTK